jgi:hypothetical protein
LDADIDEFIIVGEKVDLAVGMTASKCVGITGKEFLDKSMEGAVEWVIYEFFRNIKFNFILPEADFMSIIDHILTCPPVDDSCQLHGANFEQAGNPLSSVTGCTIG